MKTPIIKYNDNFLNKISIFIKVGGITLYPFIILRQKYREKVIIKIHESIHIKQQEELLVLPFYLLYIIEWVIKSIMYLSFKKGYYNISFEREAYSNEKSKSYLNRRKRYAWVNRIIS